jgi:23S rRNA G2445 N2-methylase RlmL
VRPTYAVTCLYGLERLLAAEVGELLAAEAERHWCEVVFPFGGDAVRLRQLRLGAGVFLEFGSFAVPLEREGLSHLARRLEAVDLAQWELRYRQFAGADPESTDLSVSVKRFGEHAYTYKDVEQTACEVLGRLHGRRTVLDPRPLELRIRINQARCSLQGRLSREPLSSRSYIVRRERCQTDPTLAAAMVRLGRPGSGDRFLDPFCGTGVNLIERALAGPCGQVVGTDVNSRRISCAAANARAAGVPVALCVADAMSLPFADRAFTHIATVPPQSDPADGRPWAEARFDRIMSEALRVLEFGCACTWLALDADLVQRAAKRAGVVRRPQSLRCTWKGRPHWITTIVRTL